ncbi:MAG: hypothetical protein KDD69_10900 [Bdellovibrionales bacterium]|nr:hypothetical protein [Bdellovibrionales bacterium]
MIEQRPSDERNRLRREWERVDSPFPPGSLGHWQAALEHSLGIPFTSGNRIEPLRNGVEIFPAMLDAIESATESIEFLTFVYWSGEIAKRFAEALCRAAGRGVTVQVLLDSLGARVMSRRLLREMHRAGVNVQWFRPLRFPCIWDYTHRTHRKILVCDGTIGFTGGVGIAAEWEGDARSPAEWRDTHFQVSGPAVTGLRAAFVSNWLETAEPMLDQGVAMPTAMNPGTALAQVIRGAACIGWSDIATLFRTICANVERELVIATAYFVPDAITRDILCRTAARGVKIQLLVPGKHTDYRVSRIAAESEFEPLLDSGIEIYKFVPTMFHSKLIIADRVLSCIGSPNFNQRSMKKDEEVCLNVLDQQLAELLLAHHVEDLSRSRKITRRAWKKRPLLRRLMESVVDPFKGEM